MSTKIFAAGLALVAGVAAMQYDAAAQSAKADPRIAAIQQRQAGMKRIGASMKTLVGFSKGDIEDPAQARAAAATMNGLARQLPGWWRPGTAVGVGKSKAKPEIWQQRRQFNERIAAFRAAAAAMNRAAATGDRAKVGEQIKPLGGSCKGCHDLYQVKS